MKASPLATRLAAEFGIVVLGVMVALWADGWAGARGDRAVERARLAALREDVVSTLEQVRDERENAEGAIASLRGLLPEVAAGLARDELRERIADGTLYGSDFHPELSVYDDLKNSGELGLLTDPALRRTLSVMGARLERLRLRQDDLLTVQQLNVDPYLLHNAPVRAIAAGFLDIDPGNDPEAFDFPGARTREFENLVVFKLDLVIQVASAFVALEEALAQVRDHIDRQLGDQ